VKEETLAIEHRDFPNHWPRIIGCDFGWDHPFAAVELVWDRDTDTVYVSRCYRVREATPVSHAAALRPWGKIPIAWPRDGRRETLEGAGIALAKQYQAQGLDMLDTHAQFEDKSISIEAGIADMLIRMETGRFKVFKHLTDWFDEFRLYHRKDGRVHKENDDALRRDDAALCAHEPSAQAALVPPRLAWWMAGCVTLMRIDGGMKLFDLRGSCEPPELGFFTVGSLGVLFPLTHTAEWYQFRPIF
jgi:hypothetical protein